MWVGYWREKWCKKIDVEEKIERVVVGEVESIRQKKAGNETYKRWKGEIWKKKIEKKGTETETEAEEDREQDLKRVEWGMEVKNEKEEREEKE